MSVKPNTPSSQSPLRIAILAGGKDAVTASGQPLVLEKLGERSILETVIENVRRVIPSPEIYVVVGHKQEEVRALLGDGYRYVVQEKPLGTGDAVLQVARELNGFEGTLLILYGDTPLSGQIPFAVC